MKLNYCHHFNILNLFNYFHIFPIMILYKYPVIYYNIDKIMYVNNEFYCIGIGKWTTKTNGRYSDESQKDERTRR